MENPVWRESRSDSRKYTPEYKLKIVMETYKSGKSITAVAAENNISAGVLSEWRREFMRKAPNIFYYKKEARKCNKDKEFVTDDYMRIIRELREMHDLTQNKVAKYLGTSQTMYARYENGLSKMPIRHLLMLAKFYGVSTDYILGVEEHKLDSGEEEDV
jgi:ribosome-binding protein aMBF1 (putative translation factor)